MRSLALARFRSPRDNLAPPDSHNVRSKPSQTQIWPLFVMLWRTLPAISTGHLQGGGLSGPGHRPAAVWVVSAARRSLASRQFPNSDDVRSKPSQTQIWPLFVMLCERYQRSRWATCLQGGGLSGPGHRPAAVWVVSAARQSLASRQFPNSQETNGAANAST